MPLEISKTSRAERRRRLTLAATLVGSCLGFATLGAYAVHGSLEFNPIALPGENRAAMTTLMPEGWKFFTRNPQEAQVVPYALRDGAWAPVSLLPNSRPGNLFGIDRAGRAQSIEIGLLAEHIPADAWTSCDDEPLACLDRAAVSASFGNDFPRPTLCGVIGLVAQKPVPWAWARSSGHLEMPSRIARVEIKC